jgi:hypothetical protein
MDDVLRVVCLCAEWCGVCRDCATPVDDTAGAFGAQRLHTYFSAGGAPRVHHPF